MENEKSDPTGTTTEFSVSGMSCEHCVQSVQKAIQGVGGVESATVTLEPGAASVRWSPGAQANGEAVVEAVKQAGYEARPKN